LIKTRDVSGIADYSEAENCALSKWLSTIEETYRLFGFSRLIPRPLELREVLLSKGGIQKQVFGVSRLPADSPTDLALPFDRTVPLANWVAKHASEVVFPYKRYDISYSFRGERAQAGRFQAFYQADVDIIGRDTLDANADAECIAVLWEALRSLDIGSFVVRLNHMHISEALLSGAPVVPEARRSALSVIDKIGKMRRADAIAELISETQLRPEAAECLIDRFSFKGSIPAFRQRYGEGSELTNSLDELLTVWNAVVALGVPESDLWFSPASVRGLDYYSGVVFETFLVGREQIGSVASGGRYDDLASTFTHLRLPGVGGSIGVTRLFDALTRDSLLPMSERSESKLFVGFRTAELRPVALSVARELRKSKITVDLYSAKPNVSKQLSYAARKGIPVALIVMSAESFVVRDLRAGTQIDVSGIDEVRAEVDNLIKKATRRSSGATPCLA
jgi:histidyl-tRNA synthetase